MEIYKENSGSILIIDFYIMNGALPDEDVYCLRIGPDTSLERVSLKMKYITEECEKMDV